MAESYIVKSEEQEAAQNARQRAYEDRALASVGMTRDQFNCFGGVAFDDEQVIVWAESEATWAVPPKNLTFSHFNFSTGHWEYWLFPLRDDSAIPTTDALSTEGY